MEPIVKLTNVTKHYGAKNAVRDVTLELQPGKIVGLLGSNGSGKSTLMKLTAGLIRPASGEIAIGGVPVGLQTRAITSFMPDRPVTESWMKVKDAVRYYADFYADFDDVKAREMLAFMKLTPSESVASLSKGMHERLQLTLALSRNAKLYMLDEPIGGVDLVARSKILDAIVQYYSENSCLIVSTHLVTDLERIFDEVVLIKDGAIVLHDDVEYIRVQKGKSVEQLFREVYAE
ncbi:ABC transporter ATP-binding protein [Paenibacillus sp. NPDC058071]|uniref:ABC transporter ATP-binding protein n=1 Tax=Paenibacillus sp. NPDC058071 TaxID=3346326 RepID=UPI0036DEF5FD